MAIWTDTAAADQAAKVPAPSPDKLERITEFFNNEVATGKLPGAVVLIHQHGKPVYLKCFGVQDEDSTRAVALSVAQGVDVDAIWPAVPGVGAGIAGLADDFLGFDHLDEARLPRLERGIKDVNSR